VQREKQTNNSNNNNNNNNGNNTKRERVTTKEFVFSDVCLFSTFSEIPQRRHAQHSVYHHRPSASFLRFFFSSSS